MSHWLDSGPPPAINIQKQNIPSYDSCTSLNSLFDASGPYTTNSITPILSRNGSVSAKQMPHAALSGISLEYLHQKLNSITNEKLIVMLVGLPASGKSTVAKQLCNFINTSSPFRSNIYNAGDVRRLNAKFNNSDFFNPNNVQGKCDRELYANINIQNMLRDLAQNQVQVGFLDATNTTVERRSRMFQIIEASGVDANCIIFDVQCTKDHLMQFNINGKANNNDYKDKDYLASIADFKLRTQHYYKVYQPLTDEEIKQYPVSMYIKMQNSGETIENLYIDDTFRADSQIYRLLCSFESNYYAMEGKKYFEAVEAFYKRN